MMVLDVAVPTGFAPEMASLDFATDSESKMKRYGVAGRKVIFYLEDMVPGETIAIRFQARAQYPVRANAVTSQVYAYYDPAMKAGSLSRALALSE